MSPRERAIAGLIRRLERGDAAHQKRRLALAAEIGGHRAKLKGCTHSITTKFTWEHDNGYGHQSRHEGLLCEICGKKNYWPTGSGSWA